MSFIHRASNSHRRRIMGGDYNDLVLGTGPIAYWPQSEPSGLVAHCLVNPAQNGTYTGVTLANDLTGPFGTPAPYYDGVNDFCNIHSAALQAAWNGAEGSAMAWSRVSAAGVWTDGAWRQLLRFDNGAANQVSLIKALAASTFQGTYRAGGGALQTRAVATSATAWQCWLMSWSKAVDEMRFYLNGVQQGATLTSSGIWAGNLAIALIGATTVVPENPWHGWLGPCVIWPRALPQSTLQILALQ